MGFRAGPAFPAQQRCLLAVAQDNDDVQYDHALRKKNEAGGPGGIAAIEGIRDRLVSRFVAAALAEEADIDIADGGAAQDHYRTSKAYFLLGRALHIVQDSFSTFHGTRHPPDYRSLIQVNSYVCTPNAPVHPHVTPGVRDLLWSDARPNGDIIWNDGCKPETAECLKVEYVAAVDASTDLWGGFLQARQAKAEERETLARQIVNAFLDTWMQVPASIPDAGAPEDCSLPELANLNQRRDACLAITGRQDAEQSPPFNWDKKSLSGIP
jgi:hypothetical protein